MASRTIENEQDRRLTIMVTTFMPCSAKLPIIALIAGAFSPYFLGSTLCLFSRYVFHRFIRDHVEEDEVICWRYRTIYYGTTSVSFSTRNNDFTPNL